MGVAAPRAPDRGWGSGPPQKIGHGSLFFGQLLSRKPISQKVESMCKDYSTF